MRILFVTNIFPNPAEPGRGTFNSYTAHALARRHDVVVVSHIPWVNRWRFVRQGVNPPARRHDGGIEVYHPTYWYPPGLLRQAYGWFLWHSIRGTVRQVLHQFQPDVVLSFWVHPDGDAALRAAAERGIPGVVMAGGSDVLVLGRDPQRRRNITDTLNRADAVVCVSAHLKRAVEDLGVAGPRVHVVHNGVDTAMFCPADGQAARARLSLDAVAPIVLWVGRMVPVKGLDVLLSAFANTRIPAGPATLCLVGEGPARASLEAQAVRLGIADRVRFVGNVTHDGLADWYRAADTSVLPSYSEGSPNVLLESIACGTPFIASNVGGIPEIADPRFDRLVPAGDTIALTRALNEALSNRQEHGAARRLCTWDEHGAAMEAVLQEAIEARRAPSTPITSSASAPLTANSFSVEYRIDVGAIRTSISTGFPACRSASVCSHTRMLPRFKLSVPAL